MFGITITPATIAAAVHVISRCGCWELVRISLQCVGLQLIQLWLCELVFNSLHSLTHSLNSFSLFVHFCRINWVPLQWVWCLTVNHRDRIACGSVEWWVNLLLYIRVGLLIIYIYKRVIMCTKAWKTPTTKKAKICRWSLDDFITVRFYWSCIEGDRTERNRRWHWIDRGSVLSWKLDAKRRNGNFYWGNRGWQKTHLNLPEDTRIGVIFRLIGHHRNESPPLLFGHPWTLTNARISIWNLLHHVKKKISQYNAAKCEFEGPPSSQSPVHSIGTSREQQQHHTGHRPQIEMSISLKWTSCLGICEQCNCRSACLWLPMPTTTPTANVLPPQSIYNPSAKPQY